MEDALHFAECPQWDRVWAAIESLREKISCVAPISRRWLILYGPIVVDVRHDQFIFIRLIFPGNFKRETPRALKSSTRGLK